VDSNDNFCGQHPIPDCCVFFTGTASEVPGVFFFAEVVLAYCAIVDASDISRLRRLILAFCVVDWHSFRMRGVWSFSRL
jgi:hypothetical protein